MSLKLTEELRKMLKEPFGELCNEVKKEDFLITVGDVTSLKAIEKGIIPDLIVYDGKVKRKPTPEIEKKLDQLDIKKIEVENPAGTISDETWIAVEEGLKEKTKIKIKGEDDLVVIPCIKLAKEGSVIYYGQPDRGIVRIVVDKERKDQTEKIIKQMEVIEWT